MGRDTDENESLKDKVVNWVERSGRALELRVARTYRENQASNILPSFPYTDPLTNGQREGDVIAAFSWSETFSNTPSLRCSLVAVTECKSGNAKPWVAFLGAKERLNTSTFKDWMFAGWAPYTEVNERLPRIWIGEAPFDDTWPATHVVAANLGATRDSHSEKNEKNEAGDAIRQVLAAAEALRAKTHVTTTSDQEARGTFIVAAVVTAAPLFKCRLGEGGEVALEEVKRFSVWGNSGDDRRRVYVMNESELPEFGRSLHYQALRASGDWPH